MDEKAFNAFTRQFAATGTRRGALAALLGATALATQHAPLLAARRKGKRRPDTLTVCHSGKTLRVPRHAVHAVLLKGGSRGACDETPPLGGGSGAQLKNVRVIMENHTNRPVDFEGIVSLSDRCVTRFLETVQPTLTPLFVSNTPRPSVLIDEKVFISFSDVDPDLGFPRYSVSLGGRVNRNSPDIPCYTATTQAPCFFSGGQVQLNVGQKKLVRTADACGPGIEIERSGDDPSGDRVFRVHVS